MHKILQKEDISQDVTKLIFEAPLIAHNAAPGQFIVLRIDEYGERFPLTITDTNKEEGSVEIIFQKLGTSTQKLGRLEAGESILDIVGPLGKSSEIKKYGTVVCVGGGVGTAEIFPEVRAYKEAGNKVITIVGARTKELLILLKELDSLSDELIVCTDDGSYGEKGVVTDPLKRVLDREKVDKVLAVGPIVMMKFVAKLTKEYNVKTTVSLNPIMVDGTGMCGSCRVTVGNEVKFACVDGPEFDAHLVDFEELQSRNSRFMEEEKHSCKIGLDK